MQHFFFSLCVHTDTHTYSHFIYQGSVVSHAGFRISNQETEFADGNSLSTTLNHEDLASLASKNQPMKFLNMVYGEDQERAKEGLRKLRCVILE